jgi:hypothetical protein
VGFLEQRLDLGPPFLVRFPILGGQLGHGVPVAEAAAALLAEFSAKYPKPGAALVVAAIAEAG